VTVLRAAGLGVLSEESGRQGSDQQGSDQVGNEAAVTVVLDPLDGSTNASRGLSWWAVSLCAVDAAGPAVALVVDLRHGNRWTAARGLGAQRDGEPIRTSGCSRLDRGHGGSQRGAGRSRRVGPVPGAWVRPRWTCARWPTARSTATSTAPPTSSASWDYLGATLVCREAGGTVFDVAGRGLTVLDHAARRIPVAGAETGRAGRSPGRELHPSQVGPAVIDP
jgi:myo-inositol-1(or 4)-monophosphatase